MNRQEFNRALEADVMGVAGLTRRGSFQGHLQAARATPFQPIDNTLLRSSDGRLYFRAKDGSLRRVKVAP